MQHPSSSAGTKSSSLRATRGHSEHMQVGTSADEDEGTRIDWFNCLSKFSHAGRPVFKIVDRSVGF